MSRSRGICEHRYREAGTQAKTDAATSVPKPSVFYAGLRGCARTGPFEPAAPTTLTAVDLTLAVGAHMERLPTQVTSSASPHPDTAQDTQATGEPKPQPVEQA